MPRARWRQPLTLAALLIAGSTLTCEVEPQTTARPCDGPDLCPEGTRCDPSSGACVPRSRPEPPQDMGRYCALAVDADTEVIAVAYAGDVGDLELLTFPDLAQAGVRTAVDGAPQDGGPDPDVGRYADLAVAADGTLHLAYYDADATALRYATRNAGGWDIGVLDDDGDAGRYASLALNADGEPRVAYAARDAEGTWDLRLARRSPSGWSVETVEREGVGRFASLVLVRGAERIAYYDEDARMLKLAARGAGGWGSTVVDDGERPDESLAHDVGRWASAAVDQGGRLGIAYFDATAGQLLYAKPGVEGAAVYEVVDPGVDEHLVGQFASLLYDDAGRARVVYQDSTSLDLRAALRTTDGTWQHTAEPLAADGPVGFWANQVLAPDGSSVVCHYRADLTAAGPAGRLEVLTWRP